jgi:methionyl-tRNA formyltransferase
MSLRTVFMGTPDFAVPTLIEVIEHGYHVAAVYTRAPQPAGRRGMALTPSPVERQGRRCGLTVFTPTTLRAESAVACVKAHRADVAIVVAYGLVLPQPILDSFPLGCFNLHASILPRWRGAAPINRAVMAGDAETGVTVMKMEAGLDTGPIAMGERIPIGPDVTAGDLHDRLASLGAGLIVRALGAIERGSLSLSPQPQVGVTYAHKIEKEETRIDWSRHWQEVHNHIRGLSPFPAARFEHAGAGASARIKVLRTTRGEGSGTAGTVLDHRLTIACGEGAVRILELQRAGRQPMKADEFLRGVPIAAGTRLA